MAAMQTEDANTIRNDRLLAVPVTEANPASVSELSEIDSRMLDEFEHFFISYNQAHGRTFKPCGRLDREAAEKVVNAALNSESRQ